MSTDHPKNPEAPSADLLMELDWQALQVSTFRAALELQVWNKLASDSKTAQRIAEENNWDVTGTQRLLDALCGMKLLDKEGNKYHLVPVSQAYLIYGTPGYMGNLFLADISWEGNGKLADAVRTGKHPIVSDWASGGIAAYWASYEAANRLHPERAIEGKGDIWKLLDVQAISGWRVLDVACGSACMTLALAKQNSGVSLTLNDWPPVVERALAIAEGLGIKQQIDTLPGDIDEVDFGIGQFDLIWIGDFLHFWGPEKIIAILKRLHRALSSSGILIVKETVVDDARREDIWLLGSLWLFGVSSEGNLYTSSEWLDFIKRAGFANPIPVSKDNQLPLWYKASKQ